MASNWIKQKSWSNEEECLDAIPDDWEARQVEDIYTQQDTGRRYDKKSTKNAGATPVIDQSADGFIGWHDSEPGVAATMEDPVVTFANHTCEMRLVRHPFSVIQNVFPLKGKTGDCDTEYLYYSTKGIVRLEEYKGHYPQFRERWIGLPPLSEQKAIAHALGTLDAKIELNRKTNATLEAMAKALFQSWFVDFDPVRAKVEGRPTGLPDEISDLFPDSFEESELGEIPRGWGVEAVGEVVECVGGSTPSTTEPDYWDEGEYFWATPKDLSSLSEPFLLNTAKKITATGVRRISSGVLPEGTVLLSSRAPVGYVAVAAIPLSINQGFIALKRNDLMSSAYLLNWCLSNVQQFKDRASGTTFAEISKAAFRPIPILVPSEQIAGVFSEKAQALYDRVVSNMKQSQLLANSRDALLPKLISGELRIPEAEKLLDEVGV